jgi:oligosaccharide repeat unit polymerase
MLVLALIISYATFRSSLKRWKYFYNYGISPSALYSGMWGFIYLIHIINPFDYRELSSWAIVLSLIPIFSIYLGEYFGLPKKRISVNISYLPPNKNLRWIILIFGLTVFVSASMLFIASYSIYGEFWSIGSGATMKQERMAIGSAAFSASKYGFVAKYFTILQGLAQVSLIMGLFYNYFNKKYYWSIIAFPLLAIIIMGVSFGSRAQIGGALWAYMLVYIVHYRGNIFKVIKVNSIVYVIVVIMLLTLVTNSTRIINKIEIKGVNYPRMLVQVFDYTVGPLIAFDNKLADAETTYGRLSFYGIESFLSMAKIVSIPPPEQYFTLEQNSTRVQNNFTYLRTLNTYSWLLFLYYDFSVLGLLIIPSAIAFIYSRQAFKYYYYSNGKILMGSFLVLLSMLLLATTSTFLFRNLDFVFSLVALFLVSGLGRVLNFYQPNQSQDNI